MNESVKFRRTSLEHEYWIIVTSPRITPRPGRSIAA